jgi:hypothetical protein
MKESKWLVLMLAAALVLGASAMLACGDDDDDDNDDSGGGGGGGGGSAADLCKEYLDKCALGLGQAYCDNYDAIVEGGECFENAVADFFSCLLAADCEDAAAAEACSTDYNSAYEACL